MIRAQTPSERVETFDPTRPQDLVASVRVPTPDEVEAAVDRAAHVQREWARVAPARTRALAAFADAVAARADAFADLMVREVGKPIVEAEGEVTRAVAVLRFYAQVALDPNGVELPGPDAHTRVIARRVPRGVVLAICPWNFPLAIPLWKAAPALAYGNTVLLKPARQAVGVAALLAEAAREALPDGVLTVLPLSGARTGVLLDDQRIAAVSFTGSTEVGMEVVVRLARRGAPAQAEMGGHNPAIVLEDADIARAAQLIVAGAAGYAGQKCTATRRAIAVGTSHEPLVAAIAAEIARLRVGDPRLRETTVGPVIDARSARAFEATVTRALESGGTLIATADEMPAEGCFVAPTAIMLDDPLAEANQEETFAPLLTVLAANDDDHAVALANATRFGLSGAVHSTEVDRAARLAARLDCGMQRVNAATTGVDYYAPFGGEGRSSFGPREQGRAARELFTSTRTLSITSA